MIQYQLENQNKSDNSQSNYNFVKFECTSTYPRLTFIIKFLPILNGVSMIQIYHQNKLSRCNDNETSLSTSKHYREIEILYGSEIKNSSNIEFRYSEPTKLKELEKYLIEYYLSNVNKLGLFYNNSHEPKYFENSLLLEIDQILNINKTDSTEQILNKIDTKFLDLFNTEENKLNNLNKLIPSNKEDTNSDFENPENTNFLIISRSLFLKEFYKVFQTRQKKINKEVESNYIRNDKDITLVLSKFEETPAGNDEQDLIFDLTRQISEIGHFEENDGDQTEYLRPDLNISASVEGIDIEKKEIFSEAEKLKRLKGSPLSSMKVLKIPDTNDKLNKFQTNLEKLQKSISIHHRRPSNNTISSPMKRSINPNAHSNVNKSLTQKIGNEKNGEPIQLNISEINKQVTFPKQIDYQFENILFKTELSNDDKEYLKNNRLDKLSCLCESNKAMVEEECRIDSPNIIEDHKLKFTSNEMATFR